jgi:hypothetical protein
MTQTRINRILFGTGGDLFTFLTRTLVWTQKNVVRFLDASDTQSKQEIAKLVDIDLWQTIHQLCRTKLKSVEDTLKERVAHLTYENKRIEEERIRCEKMKEKIHQWEMDKVKKLENIHSYIQRYTLGEKPKLDEEEMQRLVSAKAVCENNLSVAETHVRNPLSTLKDTISSYERKRAEMVRHNSKIEMKLKKLKNIGHKCDICLSDITPEQLQERIQYLQDDTKDMKTWEIEFEKEKSLIIERHKKQWSDKVAKTREEYQRLVGELSEYTHKKQQLNQYLETERKVNRYTQMYEMRSNEMCPYEMCQVSDIDISHIEEDIKQLKKYKDYYGKLKTYVGPTGIQSYLIESTTNVLCETVNRLCNMSFDIGHTEKEKLDKRVNGHPLGLMSGGEYQRLQIACFLGYRVMLQQISGWSSNLMIFDEPDTYVDASGVKEMMNMISDQTTGCTLVISHTNSLHRDMTLFDNHIEIERDEHGSRKRKRTL